jgi:hypothetical protein
MLDPMMQRDYTPAPHARRIAMDITRHGWQRDRHLAEGDAHAYFDGELESGRSLEHAIHLRHCEPCHRALNAVRARADRVAGLLRLATVQPVRSAS